MINTYYQFRYVAFLDLLGFKNMVSQSVLNQDILNNLNRALNYIGSMQHDNYNGVAFSGSYYYRCRSLLSELVRRV